jgi:ABC-type phosphate transport system substrate-binding protein
MKKRCSIIATVLLAAASAAAADLVVIANPAAGPLTKDQVADVFLGKSQALTPIDLPESSATYSDFYRKATGRDVAQIKATWARLVFSGKAQAPRQVADAAAVKKAVAADPKGVGYIEKSAVDSSVKVVFALD